MESVAFNTDTDLNPSLPLYYSTKFRPSNPSITAHNNILHNFATGPFLFLGT